MADLVGSQSRTRSGCKKCRERRVKCPEQRPKCRHCERLGFECRYQIHLSWQPVDVISNPRRDTSPRQLHSESVPVKSWMFLNTALDDFDLDAQSTTQRPNEISCLSISPKPRVAFPLIYNQTPQYSCNDNIPIPRHISSTFISSDEGHLWTYFDECITPQCVFNPAFNPYRDIILQIAANSLNGPLLHCVLAVAANQLYSIGLTRYKSVMWMHRAKALELLRSRVQDAVGGLDALSYDHIRDGQIIASTLMLCFFEVRVVVYRWKLDAKELRQQILQDCSNSWRIHIQFALNCLSSTPLQVSRASSEQQLLHQFALAYIHSHNVLAETAGTEAGPQNSASDFCASADHSTILALTGCSKKLFSAISEINRLGSLKVLIRQGKTGHAVEIERDRNSVERDLHLQEQTCTYLEDSFESEMATVTEVKRLAALLYLYGRVDGASPHKSHMMRLTSEILSLIPKISLRTNTLLWPLFIVSVLGIRPECDADKTLVLARLAALQQTRQLGNVKKARHIIEDVWKARELRPSDSVKGWKILEGRNQAISLA
ncbi:putative Zn(2)-C6 fungal-type domain-containing protein [Seiridium cardinale]|uniref:Zn(2)-C6 fungal-type domain-containing protein n=1 Tax=Seiridium cardinale TaxID=138064 RepID=A0ABR2XGA2_9PEZI